MINALNKFKVLEENEELILVYQGMVTDKLTSNLFDLAEKKLAMMEYNTRYKKKVYNILVEVLQNVYHNQKELKSSTINFQEIFLMLVRSPTYYRIASGNYIHAQNIDYLRSRIIQINSLGRDKLREQYRRKLDDGVLSEKGGAGLGLMDMARKSGEPLEFGFKKIDSDYAYFSLQAKVNF
jgi:hypothetical protein